MPGWAYEGHMRIVALAVPLSIDQAVISGIWAYVAYTIFCDGRARERRPYHEGEFAQMASGAFRSLCTRVPTAHRALFGAGTGLHRIPRRRRGSLGLPEAS